MTCEVRAVSECSLLFQHKVTFDPTSSYTLEDLKPDTLYYFQLAARSEMGVGVSTPTIEARTAQSSKCLLRLLPAYIWAGTQTHTPFPLGQGRGQVCWALAWTLVWAPAPDPERGTGKFPPVRVQAAVGHAAPRPTSAPPFPSPPTPTPAR